MGILLDFSERLRELMQEQGSNAERLGKALEIDPTVIRRWLKPEKDIYISNLIKLADYFNCSLDYICKRSDIYLDYAPKQCPPLMTWLPIVIEECHKTTYRIFKDTQLKSAYFSLWRKGAEPLLSSLEMLSNYLGCSLDRLVGRDGEPMT